jgi:hypothetical protein
VRRARSYEWACSIIKVSRGERAEGEVEEVEDGRGGGEAIQWDPVVQGWLRVLCACNSESESAIHAPGLDATDSRGRTLPDPVNEA